MDDDQRTKQLVGAILGGLSMITAAVLWAGAMIGTALSKEAAASELNGTKWLAPAFALFGIIVLVRTLGGRRS